jgi:hypothetical protein
MEAQELLVVDLAQLGLLAMVILAVQAVVEDKNQVTLEELEHLVKGMLGLMVVEIQIINLAEEVAQVVRHQV